MSQTSRSKFGDLIREVDRHSSEFDSGDICRLDSEINQVRVYYIYDSRDKKERVPFSTCMKQIEGCRNLCDIRMTYVYRNQHPRDDDQIYVITPTDDASPRVTTYLLGILLL